MTHLCTPARGPTPVPATYHHPSTLKCGLGLRKKRAGSTCHNILRPYDRHAIATPLPATSHRPSTLGGGARLRKKRVGCTSPKFLRPWHKTATSLPTEPIPVEPIRSLASNPPATFEQLHSSASNQPATCEQLQSFRPKCDAIKSTSSL